MPLFSHNSDNLASFERISEKTLDLRFSVSLFHFPSICGKIRCIKFKTKDEGYEITKPKGTQDILPAIQRNGST